LEPPIPGIQEDWLPVVKFDGNENLQLWLDSADRARLMSDSAGPDDGDVKGQPPDGREYTHGLDEELKGLRVAFSPALGYGRVDAEVAAAVRNHASE